MLRSFFISLSKAKQAQSLIMNSRLAWRAAGRFIAGVEPDDAIRVVRDLNARHIMASLDHLGENTENVDDSIQATSDILALIDLIAARQVVANVSIKLSQIGMGLSDDICQQNLKRILDKARQNKNFIRLDMEESRLVNRTLAIYQAMRTAGYDNVGVVIQAYLYRSEKDILSLLDQDTRIRLCKGAYQEPASLAFPVKADVDSNYDHLVRHLMDHALTLYHPDQPDNPYFPRLPAIATHDQARIDHALNYAASIGLPKEAFEFQMLYGIRRDLQESLVRDGYRVRVYVPFGKRWYPYFMRRLAERPENIWFFISNFFQTRRVEVRTNSAARMATRRWIY